MIKKDFVQQYWQQAIDATQGSGIFPETAIGAAILESSWGESKLTKNAFNFFGIKSTPSWEAAGGQFVTMTTFEFVGGKKITIEAKFRKYENAKQCFENYVKFVKGPRYVNAGVLEATTPDEQIHAIASAGYSTSPTYANTIVDIIEGLQPLLHS